MTLNPPKIYDRFSPQRAQNIPLELRELPQWVCWKLEYREKERASKIPVNPKNGRYADSADSKTWGKLSEALDWFLKHPGLQGVGFVFSDSDPYTGIDFDDCIDVENSTLRAWAEPWVEKLATYTEISPSLTGLKMIVRGKPPGNLKKRNRVEMYSTKRFFTFTGLPYGTCREVAESQAVLDELYHFTFQDDDKPKAPIASPLANEKLKRVRAIPDDELLALALKRKKFAALWEGDTTAYGDDLSAADAALVAHLAYWTRGDPERIDRLFRRSKLMRKKWDSRREDTTWGNLEIARAIARAERFYDPGSIHSVTLNDTSNADLFISLHDQKFLYVEPWKEWLVWNDVCWQRDGNLAVAEATRDVEKELRETHAGDLPRDKVLATFVRQSGEAWRRSAIERLARPGFAISPLELDTDPMLLACRNGVIDLRRGELRSGLREDRITRQLSIEYSAEARCPNFDDFLLEVMSDRREMVDYLWRVIGYCLTGSFSERTFFLLQGTGRNGKSTFMGVIQALLGQYARTAPMTTFSKRQRPTDAPRDDVAFLAGARLVVAQEADDEMVLDAALVKTLTGGDLFTARELYGKPFQFRPAFKLFLVTNHTPRIKESAQALWDRLHYIKFNYRVPEEKADKQLTIRLLGELDGILAKAVRGCTTWLDQGLDPPADVLDAKATLHEEADTLGEALAEIGVVAAAARSSETVLYRAYRAWAVANGVRYPVSAHTWNARLRELGFEEVRVHGAKWWKGLGLKSDPKDEQAELPT